MTSLPEPPAPLEVGPYEVVDYLRFAASYWDFGIGGHYDINWANEKGFERPYAQGYLLWATTIMWFQDWTNSKTDYELELRRIKLRFTSPIYAGDAFQLSATPSSLPLTFSVYWRLIAPDGSIGEPKAFGECEFSDKP
jgi:hypothetical protein